MIPGISLRPAVASDADAIGRAHVACWHETYTGLVPARLLENMSIDERGAMWAKVLADRRAYCDTSVYLAEQPGELAGFGSCGEQRSPELLQDGFTGEITALYVRKTAQRCGIGGALMRRMAGDLRDRGMRGATLWVLRANLPARRFYEELDGDMVAERTKLRDGASLIEVAYAWRDLATLAL